MVPVHAQVRFFLIKFAEMISAFHNFYLAGAADAGIAAKRDAGFLAGLGQAGAVGNFVFDVVDDDFSHFVARISLLAARRVSEQPATSSYSLNCRTGNTIFFSGLLNSWTTVSG